MIFISHASADDAFVAELREKLEALRIPVWVDSRNLRGGGKLAPEIESAIEQARHFLAVLSPSTVNSPWVRREIRRALDVEQRRQEDGYRVIPLLLPGLTPRALENWFDEEPVAVSVGTGPGALSAALPALLAALGERLPTDYQPFAEPEAGRVEELVLTLGDPRIESGEGKRRAMATATLEYEPADPGARRVVSRRFPFTAPLGPIETADLRWYLESYHLWPVGVFQDRAAGIERKLPEWGQALFQAALGEGETREVLSAWRQAAEGAERRFSVHVDSDLPRGVAEEAQAAAREAAAELLALPWELLHDGRAWLFQGRHALRVRRRLPNRQAQSTRPTALPLRILLISPRPERDGQGNRLGSLDHRSSARPLTEAVESLGELARLTVLHPPSHAALEKALHAGDGGQPFDVVHCDGYGVYDRRLGLGGLCFEEAGDGGTSDFVDAARLAGLAREHRIPLVFLEARQTAAAEVDATASVAARLLEEGMASVVAMSHGVLAETARRFVQAFYGELAGGARVGRAMLAGQQALFADTGRGKVPGAGELRLQDWFVPMLYQEEQDPQLITRIPPQQVRQLEARRRRLSLGDLPEPPPHSFQGRSRELLALERLLYREPWAVVRGTGGQGKTTLAAELARWLVRTGRFAQAAFVSLESHRDARAVLDTLGHQLLPEGGKYSVAQYPGLDQAFQPVERALADRPTLVVLDNCESVLPEPEPAAAVFALCRRLLEAGPGTRLLLTTREPLPPPFDTAGRERELGALDRMDAIELVGEVMKQNGWTPLEDDAGSTPQEITDLVEAVHCHARALVLLAREVARRGVRAATGDLCSLMADLERKHPGDRENSLYASVELSLRRLSAESRGHVRVLAVCHGGIQLDVLGMLTGLELDDSRELAIELIEAGLAEDMGNSHLRLDPGLPPYLLGELAEEDEEGLRARWADAMAQLTGYLYDEWFQDTRHAAELTLLELPNLLAMLDWLGDHGGPEDVVELASAVERLVTELGQPRALERAIQVRERAAQQLGGWSHARYVAESTRIERLLERRDLPAAQAIARQILEECLAAGETAYPGAPYDIGMAHLWLGRALHMGGAAEAALPLLSEARRRFLELAAAGESNSGIMASAVLSDTGECLRALGRLEEAKETYEEGLRCAQTGGDLRQAAAFRFHLGTIQLLRKRYDEALEIYTAARNDFEGLGEPGGVATIWHQIGLVHEYAGRFELAEEAYRRSLAIEVQENDFAGQASSLGQLGNLYSSLGRLEDAATLRRQAAEVFTLLQDVLSEGVARSNLAKGLIALGRYGEARQEIRRAFECKELFGGVADPWKTWSILEELERATGQAEAAQAARQQAIETYLAYRRAGGISQAAGSQLYDLAGRAVQDGMEEPARLALDHLAGQPDPPPSFQVLIPRLQSILDGDRDPALAAGPDLDWDDAAELQLLLESLSSRK